MPYKITNISDTYAGYLYNKDDVKMLTSLQGISLTEMYEGHSKDIGGSTTKFTLVEELSEEPQIVMYGLVFTIKENATVVLSDEVFERHKDRLKKYEAFQIIKIEKI